MFHRSLLSALSLVIFLSLFASEAYSQTRSGYPPGFLPSSPLYSPLTRTTRRYVGDGKWRNLHGPIDPTYAPGANGYDNNQGRFNLLPPEQARKYRVQDSPFRYPNHNPQSDLYRATMHMRMQPQWMSGGMPLARGPLCVYYWRRY